VLVATDYFTKLTEDVPLKNMTQILTMDHGSLFMSHLIHEFAMSLKARLLSYLPYYAQANGQAESSN
jgi:hypothetical protein